MDYTIQRIGSGYLEVASMIGIIVCSVVLVIIGLFVIYLLWCGLTTQLATMAYGKESRRYHDERRAQDKAAEKRKSDATFNSGLEAAITVLARSDVWLKNKDESVTIALVQASEDMQALKIEATDVK